MQTQPTKPAKFKRDNITLLFLDDDQTFTDPLCDQLSRRGFTSVFACNDIWRAMDVFQKVDADVCFVDLLWCQSASGEALPKQGDDILDDIEIANQDAACFVVVLTKELKGEDAEFYSNLWRMKWPLLLKPASADELIKFLEQQNLLEKKEPIS